MPEIENLTAQRPVEKIGVQLDFGRLLEKPRAAIWRLTQLAAFGLTASEKYIDRLSTGEEAPEPLQIPETLWHISPEHVPSVETKEAFAHWIMTATLRETVEVFSKFLEEARSVAAHIEVGKMGEVDGEVWNERIVRQKKSFASKDFPGKIEFLKVNYPAASLADELSVELLSINRLRNCLVHRFGVVAERDCNGGNALHVMWRHLIIRRGTGERIEKRGEILEKGERVGLVLTRSEKRFALNTIVSFTAAEFLEICQALILYAREIVMQLRRDFDPRT